MATDSIRTVKAINRLLLLAVAISLVTGPEIAVANDKDMALLEAARQADRDRAEYLLKHGANINVKETKSGKTPLMLAGQAGDTEVAKLLLTGGSDVNARDNEGRTALMYPRLAAIRRWLSCS